MCTVPLPPGINTITVGKYITCNTKKSNFVASMTTMVTQTATLLYYTQIAYLVITLQQEKFLAKKSLLSFVLRGVDLRFGVCCIKT
jgi:hypothetical protein